MSYIAPQRAADDVAEDHHVPVPVPADQLDYRPPPASQPDAVPPGAPAGVLQPRDDERQEGQEDAEQEALSGGRRRWLKINAA